MKKLIILMLLGFGFTSCEKKSSDDIWGGEPEIGFTRSEESKEEARRETAKFQIKLQGERIDLAKELYDIDQSAESLADLNRAKDKLERLKEAENTRKLQWEMMQGDK